MGKTTICCTGDNTQQTNQTPKRNKPFVKPEAESRSKGNSVPKPVKGENKIRSKVAINRDECSVCGVRRRLNTNKTCNGCNSAMRKSKQSQPSAPPQPQKGVEALEEIIEKDGKETITSQVAVVDHASNNLENTAQYVWDIFPNLNMLLRGLTHVLLINPGVSLVEAFLNKKVPLRFWSVVGPRKFGLGNDLSVIPNSAQFFIWTHSVNDGYGPYVSSDEIHPIVSSRGVFILEEMARELSADYFVLEGKCFTMDGSVVKVLPLWKTPYYLFKHNPMRKIVDEGFATPEETKKADFKRFTLEYYIIDPDADDVLFIDVIAERFIDNSAIMASRGPMIGAINYLLELVGDFTNKVSITELVKYDVAVFTKVAMKTSKSTLTGNWARLVVAEVFAALMDQQQYRFIALVNPKYFKSILYGTCLVTLGEVMKLQGETFNYLEYAQKVVIQTNQFFVRFGSSALSRTYKILLSVVIIAMIAYLTAEVKERRRRLSESDSVVWPYWLLGLLVILSVLWCWSGVRVEDANDFVETIERKEEYTNNLTYVTKKVDKAVRIRKYGDWPLAEDAEHRVGAVIKTLDPILQGKTFNFSHDPKGDPYFYKIAGFTASLFVPRKAERTLSVLANKVLAPAPMENNEQAEAWAQMIHELPLPKGEQIAFRVSEEMIMEWINKHDPKKIKAYRQAYEILKKWDRATDMVQVECMIKLDESLSTTKTAPRPIMNMSPLTAVRYGPSIDIVTNILKKQWGSDFSTRVELPKVVGQNRTITFMPFFAPGMSYLQLGEIVDYIESYYEDSLAVFAAGDDTAIRIKLGTRLYYIETDYSKYDASQGIGITQEGWRAGPLQQTFNVMKNLGMDRVLVDELAVAYSQPIKFETPDRNQRATVKFKENNMFPTGSPATTLNNTVNNVYVWYSLCYKLLENYENMEILIVEHCASLGLKVKVKFGDSIDDLTFLKGRWVYSTYKVNGIMSKGYLWTPDMGVAVKFGLAKKHPTEVFPRLDQHQAAAKYLASVANSWATYPPTLLLRAFVAKYREQGVENEVHDFKFKPKADIELEVLEQDFTAMLEWYRTDILEVQELESLIATTPIYSLINHKLAHRCCSLLYGDGSEKE